MSNFQFDLDPQKTNQRRLPCWLVKTVLIAGLLPFLGFGIFMITQVLHIMNTKNNKMAIPFILLVLFICAVPILGVFSVLKKLKLNPAGASPPPRAEKPWLARADWAAGKIKSSAGADLKVYFFVALAFCGIGGFSTFFVLPQELHKENYAALLVLLFPAVGIYLLVYALLQRRGRRRFGESLFVMGSVPGALGGALEGSIQSGASLRPQQGLQLRLSCIRRSVSGSGKNRQVSENILWQDEKNLKNEAVSGQGDHAVIPVYFRLPSDQPESFAHGNDAIIWRLDAKAKMSGPDFKALFDVPVFKIAGVVAAPALAADPTAALQMPIEEIRRDEHSKIQIRNAPDGREFFFPAARNPGEAFGLTLFTLIWSVVVWFLIHDEAPLLFPIVFGLVDVFLVFSLLNLWFKQSRVTFHSRGVRAASRWLIFGRMHSFDASEIARFDSAVGFTAGQHLYYKMQLITRAEKKITVANGIPNKPEADWLVQEMNKALGRKS